MKKLIAKLEQIRRSQRPGFMMHIVAGFPNMKGSEEIALQLLDSGADLLEIQIPFSDPVADGPVIASANEAALSQGATVKTCLEMIQRIAASTEKPILIMTYFNIVHHFGIAAFTDKAQKIGVQGLIIPDFPFDEEPSNGLLEACKRNDLALIQVLASTTRPARMAEILKHSSGFIYCMARTGTTGKRTVITPETKTYLSRVKAQTTLPLAVGFGLSDRIQVQALQPYANIMVVGSALIKEYAGKSLEKAIKAVEAFMRQLI